MAIARTSVESSYVGEKVSKETVKSALSFALVHGSVDSWNRYYDLAVKYFRGKVSRKEIEAAVYAKYYTGAVREV